MTTQQMIENTMLDALGLLSEEEQREFERAFWAAEPAVQAHVRREQTRLSRIESLLPKVEPPVDLRAAVVQAVREALVAQLAEPAVEEVRGRGPIPILSSLHVSPVWRAASLGFAAAAAVFGATTLFMWSKHAQVESQIRNNAFTESIMTQAGGDVRDILYRYDSVAVLHSVGDAGGEALAKLHYMGESGEGCILSYSDLPDVAGDEFRVIVIGADGQQTEVAAFRADGQGRVKFDLSPEYDGLKIALVAGSGDGDLLLLSDTLRLG